MQEKCCGSSLTTPSMTRVALHTAQKPRPVSLALPEGMSSQTSMLGHAQLEPDSSQPSFFASYAINEVMGPPSQVRPKSSLDQAPTRKGYLPVSMMNRMTPQLQISTASPL